MFDIVPDNKLVIQFFDTIKPKIDFLCIVQRFSEPLSHLSRPHCGMCLVENAEKRTLNFLFVQSFAYFKIAYSRLIKRHMHADFINIDMGKVF